MGPVGAALHVHGVRRAQRPVGGELEGRAWSGLGFGFGCGCGCGLGLELEGRAVDEGAVGEDHLVAVAGSAPRDRLHIRSYGRAALHSLAEGEHLGALAQGDRLDDVGFRVRVRVNININPNP